MFSPLGPLLGLLTIYLIYSAGRAQTLAAGCLSFSMANGDAFKAVMIFCGNLNFPILWAMNLYWFQIIASQAWGVLKGDNKSQSKAVVDHLS